MKVPRPCLQYHLHLCCAPCFNYCTKEEYQRYVKTICDLFEGKSTELVKELQQKMEQASEALEYEKAAEFRNQIRAIQSVQQRQNIISNEGDFDVVGMARDGSHTGLEVFYIRYGRMVGKENFSIPESADEQDQDIITAFIKDFYAGNPMSVPKEIILPMLPKDSELLLEWLKQIKGTEVKMIVPERGFKRKLKDMAMANAKNIFLIRNCSGNIRMPENRALLRS